MSRLVSPEELLNAAKDHVLEGKDPNSIEDWYRVFNFFAVNILSEAQPTVLHLLALILSAPLTWNEIEEISKFQLALKAI